MESALIIAVFIVAIFVVDFIARWWRENAWRRRWRQRDED